MKIELRDAGRRRAFAEASGELRPDEDFPFQNTTWVYPQRGHTGASSCHVPYPRQRNARFQPSSLGRKNIQYP
ncbi:MAG: hypothetical protein QOE88_2468 [Verrucomicrobiota bacterium]|nr:hypothetical protein [Acidobacteriaceae bacterium]MEA3164650.1 hypothetical protein [Verrucomicrobiota bacterium]